MLPFMFNTTLKSISNTSANYLTHICINLRKFVRNYLFKFKSCSQFDPETRFFSKLHKKKSGGVRSCDRGH